MAKFLRRYADSQSHWRRLDALLTELDSGVPLGRARADELYRLHRQAAADLAYLQTHTGNSTILDSLEELVARSHARLTPRQSGHLLSGLWALLRRDFPAAVRREKKLLALATVIFFAGGLFGSVMTVAAPESAATFLAAFPHILEQSPAEDAAGRMGEGIGLSDSTAFSLHLFVHNLRIALLCLALGLTFGVGTAAVLFLNGAVLGSCVALYSSDGALWFFLSWVGPHGALELPAVILSAAAGFMIARAQLAGDGGWRRAATRAAVVAIVAGVAFLLLVAAVIEGGFSQTHSITLITLKYVVAGAGFCGLLVWLFAVPVDVKSVHSL